MRTFISIVTFTILTSCNNSDTQTIKDGQTKTPDIDTTIIPKATLTNLTILVFPPYDAIANEGISPDIQKYIEWLFTTDTTFRLMKFPYRQLMNVSYQNVFDKKYCTPITDKIKTDIIIMSKIDQTIGTGNMTTDKWKFKIKIYNPKTGNQTVSNLAADNLTSGEIENLIKSRRQELFTEIKNNH